MTSSVNCRPFLGPLTLFSLLLSFFVLLLQPHSTFANPADSQCATGNHGGESYSGGAGVSCLNGDVFLKSTIVEVGIHQTGSYGTFRKAPTGYQSRSFDHPYKNNLDGK